MADVVSPEKRSEMMSGITGANTKPELIVRRGLYAAGYRYRLHGKGLPGKPDLVLRKFNAVIFVHGCFWHGHDCHLFKWPRSRPDFWREKITDNKVRDKNTRRTLLDQGWRVATVWECALKGKLRLELQNVIEDLADWLESDTEQLEIRGME